MEPRFPSLEPHFPSLEPRFPSLEPRFRPRFLTAVVKTAALGLLPVGPSSLNQFRCVLCLLSPLPTDPTSQNTKNAVTFQRGRFRWQPRAGFKALVTMPIIRPTVRTMKKKTAVSWARDRPPGPQAALMGGLSRALTRGAAVSWARSRR